MTLSIRTLIYITLLGLIVTGCSGSKNTNSRKPVTVNKVNGYVGASNIAGAKIYAVPVDVQGQPTVAEDDGSAYAGSMTTSDAKAYYVVGLDELQSQKPLIFIANALSDNMTTQRCELTDNCNHNNAAYGAGYPLGNEFKLNAVVSSVGDNSRVNINWITHLASDIAYTTYIDEDGINREKPNKAVDGMFTPFTIERGNIWLTKQFDIADIISIRPIAPSALSETQDLETNLRQQGIRYGALLAAGQKLANDAGQTDALWLSTVVNQQRGLHGQLYLNNGPTDFSLCTLYEAAEYVLGSNITRTPALASGIKADANSALSELTLKKAAACALPIGTPTNISVNIDEIKGWVDSFKQAKEFVNDLNARILNMRCDDTASEGFFDCDYVARTKTYYKGLEDLYKANKPELIGALHAMRTDVENFITCLNNGSCTNNTYVENGLIYTMVPLAETATNDGRYFAFDFRISGVRTIASGITLTFEDPIIDPKKARETNEYNMLRVVYQGDQPPYSVPAVLAFDGGDGMTPATGVEPLGFDFNFPNVGLRSNSPEQDFKLNFNVKLIGVKPFLDTDKAMHYNLTEVGLSLNVQGVKLGDIIEESKTVELKDTAKLLFKSKFSNAADFYASSLWPDKDDYFTTVSGTASLATVPNLFKYSIQQGKEVLVSSSSPNEQGQVAEVKAYADYFELEVLGVGTNRYEKYQQGDKFVLRNCSIDETATTDDEKEKRKVCTSAEEIAAGFDLINDLIYSDKKYLENFAIPGYGSYKPNIQPGIQWGDVGFWEGTLVAEFAQGIAAAELRIIQEFVDVNNGVAKRAPYAILKINGSKKTDTSWEVAVSMGYKYDYLVDVLPMGKNAQSFYFSYFVNDYLAADGTTKKINELGSLSIIREGTKLFGLQNGETVNATLASRVDYAVNPSSVNGCGYTNSASKADNCNAIAYLTVRGKLVGTLRKEKSVYVMRYSDGTYSILGSNL